MTATEGTRENLCGRQVFHNVQTGNLAKETQYSSYAVDPDCWMLLYFGYLVVIDEAQILITQLGPAGDSYPAPNAGTSVEH